MEHKIGEIFEYNGAWYQCVDWDINPRSKCDFNGKGICSDEFPCTSSQRKDKKNVFFKKLEKVGNPYEYNGKTWQPYKSPIPIEIIPSNFMYKTIRYDFIEIEIKQNQENMEENELNLKPFDLEAAKLGKPVCTRDGRKARIICFDRMDDTCPIVALLDCPDRSECELVGCFTEKGNILITGGESCDDLIMLPEKKEGWVNIYQKEQNRFPKGIFPSKDKAIESISEIGRKYIDTVKINWEE